MNDQKIYRITGISALACIATFFIEFPFYLVRSPWPGLVASDKLGDFAARNGTNVMCCVFLDLIILTLFMIFLAGVRHLIRQQSTARRRNFVRPSGPHAATLPAAKFQIKTSGSDSSDCLVSS